MTTNENEATSSSLNPSTIRDLPPVEIQPVEVARADRSLATAVVFRAHYGHRVEISPWPGLTKDSIVMASITELFPNPDGSGVNLPGLGAANMHIDMVAPQTDKVFVRVYIDHNADLTVRLSLFVV